MVSFDIVADTITRLRNAQMIKRVSTEVRFSKKIFVLIQLLCSLGYLKSFKVFSSTNDEVIYDYLDDKSFDIYKDKNKYDFLSQISKLKILVDLKYYKSAHARLPQAVIRDIAIISKQGRRKFINVEKLKISPYKNSMGTIILSTNKGLMSDQKALKLNLGGEEILKIF